MSFQYAIRRNEPSEEQRDRELEDYLAALQTSADTQDAALDALGDWTSFTPTIAQGATTDIAKTITHAAYTRIGDLVTVQVEVTITGTGTAGQRVRISHPVTPAFNPYAGQGILGDSSGGPAYHRFIVYVYSTTQIELWSMADAGGVLGQTTFTAALANGDGINYSYTYRAAT